MAGRSQKGESVPDRQPLPRVGRDQRARRVRALARLEALGAGLDLGKIGAGPRRRMTPAERERIAYADIAVDVEEGKRC